MMSRASQRSADSNGKALNQLSDGYFEMEYEGSACSRSTLAAISEWIVGNTEAILSPD
jgi:hypothetical protein